ncbi:ArdC family protein [Chitinophaga sp. 22321]|uniref:ArdC family protein n=1 Tax=Chitinophaga sp. 22321 TaxID=3453909 RepID=UPI003F87C553
MESVEQNKPATRRDIHQQVTDTIIRQLEAGTVPWHQPWKGESRLLDLPKNYTTNKKYRGINILLLWGAALEHQYTSPEWASFKQWQEKKESVRKGEKGNMIVYYDTIEREVDGELKKIPFIKTSVVFNRCQLASYTLEDAADASDIEWFERMDHIEDFIANTNAIIETRSDGAAYAPALDKIFMPPVEAFIQTETCTATEGYYSTLLHELTHWTGSKARLNREGGKKFGDQHYATEELVAELGAAFMCAEFGIGVLEKGDHAGYIDFWLKVLKENKHCIFTAVSEASKAVDFLQGLQPN